MALLDELNVFEEIKNAKNKVAKNIENYKFREALKELMQLARLGNKFLADTEPWKLVKTEPEKVATIMNVCLQITANLSIISEPFIPFAAKKLQTMLNISVKEWEKAGDSELIPVGHKINQAELLFKKIEDDEIEIQIAKLEAIKKESKAKENKVIPQKEETTFDEFQKMDIRTGTIIEAEAVPKTDKLLKLKINVGIDTRTVVSGIAEFFSPSEIIGQPVCVLVNLQPRKLKGIESQGMILMAKKANGDLEFISPEDSISNGCIIS